MRRGSTPVSCPTTLIAVPVGFPRPRAIVAHSEAESGLASGFKRNQLKILIVQ
jgi:hypothetical protein